MTTHDSYGSGMPGESGMGSTGFERALLHAIEQSRKGHWLNVAATLSEAQQVALRELSGVLKGGSITAVVAGCDGSER